MVSAAPQPPTGLLLLRGPADTVARWAGSGLTAVAVAPLEDGWTAVVPTSSTSAVSSPYEEATTLLLNRPLPSRLRPALGLGVVRGKALVAVTPARWRSVRRWLAWQPGTGLVRPGGLPAARLADLVRAAGLDDPAAVAALADVVHDPRGDAHTVLANLLTALGLPGGALLAGTSAAGELPAGREVQPSAGQVSRFERMVHEENTWHEEMGQR